MSISRVNDGILHLVLPESEYWCRSVLPGIADYVRRHTDFFLRNFDSVEYLRKSQNVGIRPAGFIVAVMDTRQWLVHEARRLGIPIVSISGRSEADGVPTVTHDNRAIGAMAARHLLDRGFKHFAYVGVGDNLLSNNRFDGFARYLEENGFPVANISRRELAGDEVRFRKWLERLDFPLGIYAAHDRCARKVCWEAEHVGFRVPEEVGVIGADNDPYQCELSRTPLSSVALRFEELGNRAAERLHGAIRGDRGLPERILVPPASVVERRSTDFLAVPDELARLALQKMKVPRDGTRLGVAELARSLGVSKSSLEKRFKAATGNTVFEAIHRFRMERARSLVDESGLSVDEVSERIGISDTKRFTKLFKERYGETPTAFRRKRRLA